MCLRVAWSGPTLLFYYAEYQNILTNKNKRIPLGVFVKPIFLTTVFFFIETWVWLKLIAIPVYNKNHCFILDRVQMFVAAWHSSITCWSPCRESLATRCCLKITWRNFLLMTLTVQMRKVSWKIFNSLYEGSALQGSIWLTLFSFVRIIGNHRHSSHSLQQRHQEICKLIIDWNSSIHQHH